MNENEHKEWAELMKGRQTDEDERVCLLSLIEQYQKRQKTARGIVLEESKKMDKELLQVFLDAYDDAVEAAVCLLLVWQISDDEVLLERLTTGEIDTTQARDIAIRDLLNAQYAL